MVMMEDWIRSIELWLRLVKQQQQPLVDPNLDPVLLDPGIPRSILMADDNGKEERMCGLLLAPIMSFGRSSGRNLILTPVKF
ncbi:hypothetical protein BHE74_00029979 [Ensete ventricosum]|nr:hypothetical protein BHE74_00029979 [Ensete ventricosum]